MVHLLRHTAPVLQEVLALRRAMKRFGRAKLAEDCSAELQGDTWMFPGSCWSLQSLERPAVLAPAHCQATFSAQIQKLCSQNGFS